MQRMYLISALLVFMTFPVMAQSFNQSFEAIIDMNRIKPLQNPDYETATDIIEDRVLDNKNRVVGEVKDVVVNRNGSISSMLIEFNRIRRGHETYVNYNSMGMRPVTNGFSINMSYSQLDEFFPKLLAETETAAGGENVYSVKKITGSKLVSEDGKNLGVVEDVLFGGRGDRAEALYVSMTYGILRGEHIAVPFSSVDFETGFSGLKAVVSKDEADALLAYAENN